MEKITKLISLSDFVDHIDKQPIYDETALFYIKIYNNFLKQPLTRGMFVPIKDNEFLIKPEITNYDQEELEASVMGVDIVNYNEAKLKILFECFKCIGNDEEEIELELFDENVWLIFTDVCTVINYDGYECILKDIEDLYQYLKNDSGYCIAINLSQAAIKQIYG